MNKKTSSREDAGVEEEIVEQVKLAPLNSLAANFVQWAFTNEYPMSFNKIQVAHKRVDALLDGNDLHTILVFLN